MGRTATSAEPPAAVQRSGPGHSLSKFDVSARGIRELHLPRVLARWLDEAWVSNQDARASSSGRRHVEPVKAVKELHPTWRVFRGRRGHRVDNNGVLAPGTCLRYRREPLGTQPARQVALRGRCPAQPPECRSRWHYARTAQRFAAGSVVQCAVVPVLRRQALSSKTRGEGGCWDLRGRGGCAAATPFDVARCVAMSGNYLTRNNIERPANGLCIGK